MVATLPREFTTAWGTAPQNSSGEGGLIHAVRAALPQVG